MTVVFANNHNRPNKQPADILMFVCPDTDLKHAEVFVVKGHTSSRSEEAVRRP